MREVQKCVKCVNAVHEYHECKSVVSAVREQVVSAVRECTGSEFAVIKCPVSAP